MSRVARRSARWRGPEPALEWRTHDPATAHRPRTRAGAQALLLGAAAQAQVYMGSDAQGTLVLSNHASSEAPELLLAAPADPAAAAPRSEAALPQPAAAPLSGEIRAAAQRHARPSRCWRR